MNMPSPSPLPGGEGNNETLYMSLRGAPLRGINFVTRQSQFILFSPVEGSSILVGGSAVAGCPAQNFSNSIILSLVRKNPAVGWATGRKDHTVVADFGSVVQDSKPDPLRVIASPPQADQPRRGNLSSSSFWRGAETDPRYL